MKKQKWFPIVLSCICMLLNLFVLFPVEVEASTYVSTQYGVYSKYDTITFSYSGANPSNKDWIGIYKDGTPTDGAHLLAFRYAGSSQGTVSFTYSDFVNYRYSPQKGLPLARGKYKAYLFRNDGYSYSGTPCTFWIEGDDPTMSFDVLSDFHANNSNTYNANGKITDALTDLLSYSVKSKAVIVNGDAVDGFFCYEELQKAISRVPEDSKNGYLPDMYFNLGNHEFFTYPNEKYTWSQEGKLEEFKSKIAEINLQGNNTYTYDDFGNTTYFKMEKGNCHFVFLAAQGYPKNGERAYISDEQVQWAYTQVYRLAKNYPNDPIFVFVHEPFYNTVGGSIKQYMDNDSTLRWYLNKFPTVTVFTSHSHDDINSSNWVYQEQKASAGSGIGMTLFNTASVGDVWKNNQDYGSQTDSQGLHVDVYDDSIVVRARDFANKRWIKEYKIDLNAKRASLANSNIG